MVDYLHSRGSAKYIYNPKIRDMQEDHDLTQKFVASMLGTTQQYYSEYGRGIREIPLHCFIKLAKNSLNGSLVQGILWLRTFPFA